MDATKIKLPLLLVCTIVGMALGAGGTFATTKGKIDAAAEVNGKQDVAISELNKEREAQGKQIVKVQTQLEGVEKSLDRIERHLGTKR